MSKVLERNTQIDQTRIAVIGHSYGGFVAAHLAIRYPNVYTVISLTNPIINLAGMASTSSIPDWVWQMLGKNYTHSSVIFTDKLFLITIHLYFFNAWSRFTQLSVEECWQPSFCNSDICRCKWWKGTSWTTRHIFAQGIELKIRSNRTLSLSR